MQELVTAAWTHDGPRVLLHVGELAWQEALSVARETTYRLWLDHAGPPVAFARLFRPGDGDLVVRPDARTSGIYGEVLGWLEEQAERPLDVSIGEADGRAVDVLSARGYVDAAPSPRFVRMQITLDELPVPCDPPAGYTVRPVGEADIERRVAVHQAAFAPSRLTVEAYERATRLWPYLRELDWVVEAADGSFASYALAWFDPHSHVVELEPVGTHPEHRRRGLARTVCLAALEAGRDRGAETAVVYARSDDERPEARRLYRSLGFRPAAAPLVRTLRT